MAAIVMWAGGCASGDGPQTLEQYAIDMQVAIDGMQAELAAHHDGMHQLGDLDAVDGLEWRHMDGLADSMAQLERAHDGVTMCGQHMARMHRHPGMTPLMAQNGAIDELLDGAYREIGRHAYAMDMADGMPSSLAEESEHARVMDELIARITAHCEGMMVALDDMAEGASMGCPAYTRPPAR
jgi:hypothetical protein